MTWLKCIEFSSKLYELSWSMTKPAKYMCIQHCPTILRSAWASAWSESVLSVWRKFGSITMCKVHSEDSDQTGWMHRLVWVLAGHTSYFVAFVVLRLILSFLCYSFVTPGTSFIATPSAEMEQGKYMYSKPQKKSETQKIAVIILKITLKFSQCGFTM